MILFTVVRWSPWPQEDSPDDLMTTTASCPQNQIISPSARAGLRGVDGQSISRPTPCTQLLDFGMPAERNGPAEAGPMRWQTWTPSPPGGSPEIIAGMTTTVRR